MALWGLVGNLAVSTTVLYLELDHHKPQSTCFDLAHVYCARDKADGGLGIVATFNTRSNIDNDPPKQLSGVSLVSIFA